MTVTFSVGKKPELVMWLPNSEKLFLRIRSKLVLSSRMCTVSQRELSLYHTKQTALKLTNRQTAPFL